MYNQICNFCDQEYTTTCVLDNFCSQECQEKYWSLPIEQRKIYVITVCPQCLQEFGRLIEKVEFRLYQQGMVLCLQCSDKPIIMVG